NTCPREAAPPEVLRRGRCPLGAAFFRVFRGRVRSVIASATGPVRSGAALVRGPRSSTDRACSGAVGAVLVQGPRSSGIAFATGPVVQGRVRSGTCSGAGHCSGAGRVGT